MIKRVFSYLIILILLVSLCASSAYAEGTVYANLGSSQAGIAIDQLIGKTDTGTAELTAGTLPEGTMPDTELREDGAYHFLRGTPSQAGYYSFAITVYDDMSAVVAVFECAVSVTPAVPVIEYEQVINASTGSSVHAVVKASAPDGGQLSYQWYAGTSVNELQLLEGETGESCEVSSSEPGTLYYCCEVTNSSNALAALSRSGIITVNIADPDITGISVYSMPKALEYEAGSELDTSGLKIEVDYSNGTSEILEEGFEISAVNLDTEGTKQVAISYMNYSCSYPVLVRAVEEKIESIQVLTPPYKTQYDVGRTISLDGLTLRVTTNKGNQDISTGFFCTPTTFYSEGVQTVTVFYGDKSCTFEVSISPAVVKLTAITVDVMPNRITYTQGDWLDTTGMVLTAKKDDGSSESLLSGFTCNPTRLDKTGTQPIKVTYSGLECMFYVTVKEKQAAQSATATEATAPADTGIEEIPKVSAAEDTGAPVAAAEPSSHNIAQPDMNTTVPSEALTVSEEQLQARQGTTAAAVILVIAVISLLLLTGYVFIMRNDRLRDRLYRFINGHKK